MIGYISPSKLKTYLICPLKFRLSYMENLLNVEKEKNNKFLLVFSYVHKVIYKYISDYSDINDLNIFRKILYEYWDKNEFENESEERKTGLEILSLLTGFYELYNVFGSTRLLNHFYNLKLNDIIFSGNIEHLVEKVSNTYHLFFYKTGRIPSNDDEIYNDYKIILSLIFLKYEYNIIPEKIQIFFLKSREIRELYYTAEDIESLKDYILESANRLVNDLDFLPQKNKFCYYCDFRIICPLFSDDVSEYKRQIELKYRYFKLLEYSKLLNQYTFSIKNLMISFNKILEEEENIKDVKYQFIDREIENKISKFINENRKISCNLNSLLVNDNYNVVKFQNDEEVFVFSIILNDETAGYIYIFHEQKYFSESEITFLSIICSYFNSTFQNAYYFLKSITDGLTKLFNNAYYNQILEREIKLSLEYNQPLGLIITDIDHFKNFNDTYGHKIGDIVLIEVANVLKNSVALTDYVFRYGGEEFVILVPNKSLKEVVDIAETIRKNVENNKVEIDDGSVLSVAISLGVAVYPENLDDINSLFIAADDNLYKSKENGRNRVSY